MCVCHTFVMPYVCQKVSHIYIDTDIEREEERERLTKYRIIGEWWFTFYLKASRLEIQEEQMFSFKSKDNKKANVPSQGSQSGGIVSALGMAAFLFCAGLQLIG